MFEFFTGLELSGVFECFSGDVHRSKIDSSVRFLYL
jgi:hypothetical protein